MEYLDIVDDNDHVIGKASKEEVYEQLLTHRIAHVLIFNNKGEMALQLRTKTLDFCPCCWSTAVGGHVQSGETYAEAALREYKEELGVQSKLEYITKEFYCVPGRPKKWVTIFKTNFNGPFKRDSDVVKEIKFFSIDKIKEMIKKGEKFHPELLLIIDRLF